MKYFRTFFLFLERLYMRHYYDMNRLMIDGFQQPFNFLFSKYIRWSYNNKLHRYIFKKQGRTSEQAIHEWEEFNIKMNVYGSDYDCGWFNIFANPFINFGNMLWLLSPLVVDPAPNNALNALIPWFVISVFICICYYRPHYLSKANGKTKKRKKESNHLRYFREFDQESKTTKRFGLFTIAWYFIGMFMAFPLSYTKRHSFIPAMLFYGTSILLFLSRIIYVMVLDHKKSKNETVKSQTAEE